MRQISKLNKYSKKNMKLKMKNKYNKTIKMRKCKLKILLKKLNKIK